MNNNTEFDKIVVCPWCNKGKVIANRKAHIIVSCQCPKCGRYFGADFEKLTATKSSPIQRGKQIRAIRVTD
jgi:transcription elongation factor Elf1